MKILYGIQGTGNGHITRARHMASSLAARDDIQVDYFFSGRHDKAYFDMQIFEQYKSKQGLSFVTENGQIQYTNTLLSNNLPMCIKDISELKLGQYDLLINDFEPLTAWAAKKAGLPSLSISHQSAFLQRVPKQDQSLLDKIITKYFAPTTYSLGTHWYHFGQNIIPPIVAKELSSKAQKHTFELGTNRPVLVYLPFENLAEIKQQLQTLSEQDFVCYHPEIKSSHKDKNIHWHALSVTGFKQDLIACSGVISNCGFELSTECLSLGKALLVKPLRKQYEQLSNAYTLEKLGLCEILTTLNTDDIDDWLQKKEGVKLDFPNNCDELVEWIKQGNWKESTSIKDSLWQQVRFPNQIRARLEELQSF